MMEVVRLLDWDLTIGEARVWLPWGDDNWQLKVRVERKVHKICSWLRMHAVASMEDNMGRAILLWLLGVPIPIIILLALFWH